MENFPKEVPWQNKIMNRKKTFTLVRELRGEKIFNNFLFHIPQKHKKCNKKNFITCTLEIFVDQQVFILFSFYCYDRAILTMIIFIFITPALSLSTSLTISIFYDAPCLNCCCALLPMLRSAVCSVLLSYLLIFALVKVMQIFAAAVHM